MRIGSESIRNYGSGLAGFDAVASAGVGVLAMKKL